MKLIEESNEKPIIVGLAVLVSFVGLQILQLIMRAYEIPSFVWTSWVVFAALVFLQTFVFDLHIKRSTTYESVARNFVHALNRRFRYMWQKHHWLQFQNYVILPSIVFWSTVAVIFLNPFHETLKQAWILLSTAALAVIFWYLKTIFYDHKGAGQGTRQHIFLVKLYASYLSYAASLGLMRFFGFEVEIFILTIFSVTFLLVYQAMFQHHNVSFQTLKFVLVMALLMSGVGAVVFLFWPVNYFTGALVMTAVYNAAWGMIHHKYMDRDLTRLIVYEYLAVLFLVLVVIMSITNFAERI